MKKFVAGFLTCALILGSVISALAISGRMSIEVDPINIKVNGQAFAPTDVNGHEVPVFAYNGTTYAPLRAMAEAYGLVVGYDEKTNMATVNDPTHEILDHPVSPNGKYQVAFICDVGQLKDKSFNESTYDGVKRYAAAMGKSYKYYRPDNGYLATDGDRYNAMKAAVENGAEVVVATGFMQEAAMCRAAKEFPNVPFIFIDGYPLLDDQGKVLANVAAISFCEEQQGYLAGYAVVKEGFERLGFAGGGGGINPAVCRYGYGFVQGANAAAAEMDKQVEINYTYQYGATFSASPELQALTADWYTYGTEIIFVAGGSMFQSVTDAASANDGYVVGVDVDQSFDSDTMVTSAIKRLDNAARWALSKTFNGEFDEIGGQWIVLEAAEDAVGLPTATWSMTNYSVEDYKALLAAIKNGSVEIDNTVLENDAVVREYSNVTVNYI